MKTESLRIALAQINPTVGDLDGNVAKVVACLQRARQRSADLLVTPELALTGYPPEDLLFKPRFVADNIAALKRVAQAVPETAAVVGFVDRKAGRIYNAAALLQGGRVRAVYHKIHLPNYGVFDEVRYFTPGAASPVYGLGKSAFGVNICEDIWKLDGPARTQAGRGARFIVNLNASPYHMGKGRVREGILRRQARAGRVPIVYVNCVGGQDELVFDGQSFVVDARGRVIARARAFEEELLCVDLPVSASRRRPSVALKAQSGLRPGPRPGPAAATRVPPLSQEAEVYAALVTGLRDYMHKNGFKKAVLGLSGGIDSSLVAALAADAVGADNVVGVRLPSVYSSQASAGDAAALAGNLGVTLLTVPIQGIFEKYLEELKPAFGDRPPDVAEENLQARIRGTLIMALSNKFGYLALNTGNKSEVSCGYCTLYGDMAGGFGVLKDVPKMLVYRLCRYRNSRDGRPAIPASVLEKEPTAELRPDQKDADTLPPYDVLDRVLRLYVEEDLSFSQIAARGLAPEVVRAVIRMVDANEYKRRQAAPGIKITPRAFGKDRRMPITNRYRA
ncbi:MAG: NAD+ synthase [Deltaproteobacteria bacterium]